ncbi:ribosomal L28e protein family-domain-containing protein [Mycena rebaudengoi]|nr:ribosomal L28e protein family-domain-containing protein [Mycena rebaudengoi]
MSTDLQWLLLRKNNSFMVKRVTEGPVFSKEPGNLRNLHSHKFSGLANSKTIHIADSGSGIQIVTRKTKASPSAVSSASSTSTVRARSGGRRSIGIAAGTAKRGYRPDLRTAALARISALIAAQREPKPAPAKKSRSKKSKAPAPVAKARKSAAAAADDDDDLPDLV